MIIKQISGSSNLRVDLIGAPNTNRQFMVLSFTQNDAGKGFMTAYDSRWDNYWLFSDMDLASTSFSMTTCKINVYS